MSKVNSIKDLRNKVLEAMSDLESGKITIQEALTISKLSDSIMSTLKSEMQYSVLINRQPSISFYGDDSGIELKGHVIKKIF